MGFQLQKASKVKLQARMALVGPSGAGKTYTALEAALALTDSIEKVAVVDTERGSAALYADVFGEFLHGRLDPPFSPKAFTDAIDACVAGGAEVVIIDSLTHAWSGQGGVLEMVDDAAARNRGNKFAAWREGTPEQNRLIDHIMRVDAHVIACMRAKTEYSLDKDSKGRTTVTKLGLAPEQRAGLEYEFDIVADVNHDHQLMVSKSRFREMQDEVVKKPGREWFAPFAEWLDRGERPATPQERAAEALVDVGIEDDDEVRFVARAYQKDADGVADLSVDNARRLAEHLRIPDKLERIQVALQERQEARQEADAPAEGEPTADEPQADSA